jgi:SnoaL-like protein
LGFVTASELVSAYLAALAAGDAEAILDLFTPGAVVNSPLYGPTPAVDFFPRTIADTGAARLTLLGVMEGRSGLGSPLIAFWFHFDWRLASGAAAPFNAVDVAELSEDGRISALHIVYDTVDVRPVFEAETGFSYRKSRVG